MATGTKKRESATPETTHHDEAVSHDETTQHESGEGIRRRSFSLRALLPGPYVRYPK